MEAMYDHNRRVYRSPEIVARYSVQAALQPPERLILDILRPRLASMSMLDLGVGGGRTTVHFAPLVREYVATDCSPEMIDACRRRFRGSCSPHATFMTADIRAGTGYCDHYFDFVLSSFNGLDSLDHEERGPVLRIIRRALRPGGCFVFSAHNILSLAPHVSGLRLSWAEPLRSLAKLGRHFVIRALNRGLEEALAAPHAAIRDTLRPITYYVHPVEQLRQLAEAGFESVRVFSLVDAREITRREELPDLDDKWLYYLCQ